MKKLFFSTILVLGFSVSGLANGIELKDLNLEKNFELENSKDKYDENFEIDCRLEKFKAYTFFKSKGFTHEQALSSSWSVYFNCELTKIN